MLHGFFMYLNGNALTKEQFLEDCLSPICGDMVSREVMYNLTYQIISAGNTPSAKNSLIKYDVDGRQYICYKDFGVYLKIYCQYIDNICVADIVECRSDTSQPQ